MNKQELTDLLLEVQVGQKACVNMVDLILNSIDDLTQNSGQTDVNDIAIVRQAADETWPGIKHDGSWPQIQAALLRAVQLTRDSLAQSTVNEHTDLEKRHGANLINRAKTLGWKNDGEGPLEYLMRRCYEQGSEDGHPNILGHTIGTTFEERQKEWATLNEGHKGP